ncbi:hypothetical protein EON65_23375, partial [archaeon]
MKSFQVGFKSSTYDAVSRSNRSVDSDDDDSSAVYTGGAHIFDTDDTEKSSKGVPNIGRRLSWSSVSTCNVCEPLCYIAQEDKMTAEKFRILMKPPEFDRDDLLCSVHNFISGLADYVPSIRNDKTFTVFKSIRSFLTSNDSSRLFGLLIHFTYWNVIHPTARSTMRAIKELTDLQLFITVDLQSNEVDKRIQLPPALVEIAMKEHRQASPKTFDQIDQMFHEQYEESQDQNKLDSAALASPYKTLDNASVGQMSLGSLDSETSLTAMEKEQLYIQLESCIIALFKKMGRSRFALVTGRQALISCCHFVVDEVLSMVYPWLGTIEEGKTEFKAANAANERPVSRSRKLITNVKDINMRFRRLIHQSISDIIDPSRVYTSTMLLNALLGFDSSTSIKAVAKKAHGLTSNEGRGKYYKTSSAILALLGDSTSYKARKFLQHSGTLYTPLPGVVRPYAIRSAEERKKTLKSNPKTIVSRILENERAEEKKKATTASESRHGLWQRMPLDFSKLSQDQPDADFFPRGRKAVSLSRQAVPAASLDYTNAIEQSGLTKRKGLSPLRITIPNSADTSKPPFMSKGVLGETDYEGESLNSDTRSFVGHPQAELPISTKAKGVLMDLMVDKTTKLYAAAIKTDKTALKIALTVNYY